MTLLMMRRTLCLLLLIPAAIAAGCGYQFSSGGKSSGLGYANIAIPMFESSSTDLGFEADFTRVVREEFISHARLPLVNTGQAAAQLIGRIYAIRTYPVTFDFQTQTVQGNTVTHEVTGSRRLRVRMDIRLVETKSGKVVWHDRAMEAESSFRVDTDPLVTRFNREQALETIARRLAKRIYMKSVERF